MSASAVNLTQYIVKQVSSGDTVIVKGPDNKGLPEIRTISLKGVSAPKLARFIKGNDESEDEPFAWEAREFLRKLLVGKQVYFAPEKTNPTATSGPGGKVYGSIYLATDPTKDITELLVTEGFVRTRSDNKTLNDLQEKAKFAKKGIWSGENQQKHIRRVVWSVNDNQTIFKKFGGKLIPAVIEHVRDGSTVRAFLQSQNEEKEIPYYYYVTVMLTGIRAPSMIKENNDKHDIATRAQYFVEKKVLQQQDVEILIEYADTTSVRGSVFHQDVNIAESILLEGYAQCIDIAMGYLTTTRASTLRAAERQAKGKKLHIWANWESSAPVIPQKDKEFQATVVEVINGDAFMVKQASGAVKKIFLSSVRPPREKIVNDESGKPILRPRGDKKPLYDIPWMFEAREYLRKTLIGKKVSVTVDYIQPTRENLPEKICCTVLIGGTNVGESLIGKGLASVVTHGQNDDQRSSQYDKLFEAEQKAKKALLGLYAKKDVPIHKVVDVSHDHSKAKQFFPYLRTQKKEALVEFVASGSRMRLFIPKESWLITFSLGGINCPRAPRPATNAAPAQKGEPYGEEALQFTKERCLQREVQINVESMDKLGNFFGWLWIESLNLSVALVKAGLASVHPSAESSEHYRALKAAEDTAKKDKLKIWKDYVEVKKEETVEEDKVQERKINYEKVVITEVTSEGHFFAQNTEQGPKLENLMERLRQEFTTTPPLTGEYTPRKGDLCAAKFSVDDQWYRAKIEKVQGPNVSVLYIDYGNRETINVTRCARLPDSFKGKPYASEYTLACVLFPQDEEYREDAVRTLKEDILDKVLLLNVEDKSAIPAVSLKNPVNNKDIARELIFDGLLLVEQRRERRFAKLISDYKSVQEDAKKSHVNIWQYGDITEDDAKEFGIGR